MSKSILLGTAGAVAALALLAAGYLAGQRPAVAADARPATEVHAAAGETLDRAGIEAIVREYLVANPEILREMQAALDAMEREEEQLARLQLIADSADSIFNDPQDGIFGNPEGSVTIVEFFDYNCGYCKRAMIDMQEMVEADSDLRFVLKELPILGPDSQKAHVVSMAFKALAPERYPEFHTALLGGGGRAGEASAIRIATDLGVDEAALRAEMENPAINEAFSRTYDLANKLSITGTPSYVIGTEVVYGALGTTVLARKVEEARAAAETDGG